MRIRVSTVPPLSLTKVWSSLSSLPSAATVSDLKHSLCIQIPALKGLKGNQTQLFVDGFELLDALPIDIVRENDIVYVKRVDSRIPTSVLRKRKRSDSTTSSSSSSSSSPSSSSSDSSSDSESATDSSSGSGASSPKFKAAKLPTERQQSNQRLFVPPGMGKPATHSRNTRRRRKLQHERNAPIRDPDDPTVGVNAIPLGNHNRTEELEATSQTVVSSQAESAGLTMASLSNKNKRKGFKNAMRKEVPPKIIFSEQVDPNANLNGRVQAPAPRLVPPSEKQEKGLLPPNVFVTRVDVEEGLRPSKKSKSVIPETKRLESPPAGRAGGEIDRAAIEAEWDLLGLVSGVTGLPTGTVVGWKALGINPVTITPEMMLHVGTVVGCNKNQVTVKFSDWAGARAGVEEEVDEIEESHEWGEIVGQWRIVSV